MFLSHLPIDLDVEQNFQGVCESIIGPALVDLKDLYRTDVSTISLGFTVWSIGCFIGNLGSKI